MKPIHAYCIVHLTVLVATSVACVAGRSIADTLPDLGWQVERGPFDVPYLMVPGGALVPLINPGPEGVTVLTSVGDQSLPIYTVSVGGVPYIAVLAPSGEPRLHYLMTSSDAFEADAGLRVGMSWHDLTSVLGDVELVIAGTYHDCYVCLESGWAAMFLPASLYLGSHIDLRMCLAPRDELVIIGFSRMSTRCDN